jgi:hypothetical protein
MPVLLTAAVVAGCFALPGPAQSAEQKADGLRNSNQIEVSSARRHRRHVYRAWRPRYAYRPYYRPYSYYGAPYYQPSYYGGPYYAYASPYSYYAPGPFVSVGPFGFGFGVGW